MPEYSVFPTTRRSTSGHQQTGPGLDQDRRRFLGAAVVAAGAAGAGRLSMSGNSGSQARAASADRYLAATAASFGKLKQVKAGVLNVGYAEAGPASGQPVILMHGFPYDIHSYVEVAPLLAAAGYRVDPARHHIGFVKHPLSSFAAWVPDQPGGAADQADRPMPGKLKPTHGKELHEVPNVQARGGRVESGVQRDLARVQGIAQIIQVSGDGDQAAPDQVVNDVGHRCILPSAGSVMATEFASRPRCWLVSPGHAKRQDRKAPRQSSGAERAAGKPRPRDCR